MKASDRGIVVGVAVLVMTILFYFMVLGPKRERAAELSDEIASLEESISQQEEVATFAEQARQQFPTYYGRLVVLGKAVPEQADTGSMLVQLNSIANRKNVDFRGIKLKAGASGTGTGGPAPAAASSAAAAPAPTTPSTESSEGATPAEGTTEGAAPSGGSASASTVASAPTAPAAATEATAASLPIGAAVGPAGLPTLPYELFFKGGFFNIAGYLGGLDSLVQMREGSGQVSVDGRLMTIDGFALKGGGPGSDPELTATLTVTSYVVPAEQGLTAGATPTAPAPAAAAPTTPASSVTP